MESGLPRGQTNHTEPISMTQNTPHRDQSSSTDGETIREFIAQNGQYTVAEVKQLDGVRPMFDAYDLILRGHTAVTVGDQNNCGALNALAVGFQNPVAVEDIGVELLRASHIIVPLEAITMLEEVTGMPYSDTRWIENPLNHSTPFRKDPITYPSTPAIPGSHNDDDDGGAITTT